ncbi:MAG: hypothetical protein ACXWN0_18850, partial [Isosphaeraceae bacterium]
VLGRDDVFSQVAVFFSEAVIWLAAVAYCAACAAFVIAMTYAFLEHGPWGVPAQGSNRQVDD